MMFNDFRKCLGGAVRDTWDVVRAPHPISVAGFGLASADFISKYIKPTGLADQRVYLATFKKPSYMGVRTASSRLKMLNKLMRQFPLSGGNLPYTEEQLKYAFYEMMDLEWQRDFSKTTQQSYRS